MPLINSVFIFLFRSFLNYAFLKKKNQAQIPTIVWSNLWFAAGLSIYDQYKIIKLQLFTFFSVPFLFCATAKVAQQFFSPFLIFQNW